MAFKIGLRCPLPLSSLPLPLHAALLTNLQHSAAILNCVGSQNSIDGARLTTFARSRFLAPDERGGIRPLLENPTFRQFNHWSFAHNSSKLSCSSPPACACLKQLTPDNSSSDLVFYELKSTILRRNFPPPFMRY